MAMDTIWNIFQPSYMTALWRISNVYANMYTVIHRKIKQIENAFSAKLGIWRTLVQPSTDMNVPGGK